MKELLRTKTPRAAATTIVVGVLLAAGCSSAPQGRTEVLATGRSALPAESSVDLVSFGDAAAVVTVVSEASEPSELVEGQTSWTEQRTVTAVVEEVVWRATDSPAIDIQDKLRLQAQGSLHTEDGALLPIRLEGSTRLEVGGSYLVMLVHDYAGLGSGWQVYDPSTVVGVVDGVLDDQAHGEHSAPLEFLGSTVLDARVALSDAKPEAAEWSALPALRQAEAAGLEQQLDELEASASPAEPGEESAPSADAEELRAALDRLTAEAERSG